MNNHARTLLLALLAVVVTAFLSNKPDTQKDKAQPSFLFVSDAHVNTQSDSSKYGGDTGMALWHAFLKKMEEILSSKDAPQFIVYTGDLPAHYKCNGSCYLAPADRAQHNADIDTALTDMDRLANKYHKPFFYVSGNNDPLAGDYYSFADEQQKTPLSLIQPSPYFFPNSNAAPAGTAKIISNPRPSLGYYSAYAGDGLRLIALNTTIFHRAFKTVDNTSQAEDAKDQIDWLAGQLADAEAKKEKVYIAMHVPPGTDAYSRKSMWAKQPDETRDWLYEFLYLVTRYQYSIAGMLYGHTHMDEVRRLYDTTGSKITAIAISCPGVTPQHYNNPGFKVVTYNAASKQPMDFITYYTTPGASAWGNASYTFDNTYGKKADISIAQFLRSLPLDTIDERMNRIYAVKNPIPLSNTAAGIEVKPGQ